MNDTILHDADMMQVQFIFKKVDKKFIFKKIHYNSDHNLIKKIRIFYL